MRRVRAKSSSVGDSTNKRKGRDPWPRARREQNAARRRAPQRLDGLGRVAPPRASTRRAAGGSRSAGSPVRAERDVIVLERQVAANLETHQPRGDDRGPPRPFPTKLKSGTGQHHDDAKAQSMSNGAATKAWPGPVGPAAARKGAAFVDAGAPRMPKNSFASEGRMMWRSYSGRWRSATWAAGFLARALGGPLVRKDLPPSASVCGQTRRPRAPGARGTISGDDVAKHRVPLCITLFSSEAYAERPQMVGDAGRLTAGRRPCLWTRRWRARARFSRGGRAPRRLALVCGA